MRAITLTLFLILSSAAGWAQTAFGTWKMNPARSVFIGDPHPRLVTIRFEPHPKGEVFTWDKVGGNGQTQTFSIILYFDSKQRDFQDDTCSGRSFQSSRRLDHDAVEILLKCENKLSARFIRRPLQNPREMFLDITDELPDGRRLERHLVLERQLEK